VILQIVRNPNKQEYDLITNLVRKNDNFCPCRLEKTQSNKCMCDDFLRQDYEGECHCGRFVKILI